MSFRSVEAVLVAAFAVMLGCALAACGDTKKPGTCKADKDCQKNKTGQVCFQNKCVECTTNAQCPAGKQCTGNACVVAAECTKDEQCPEGKVCQAGKCKACAADADCGPGGACNAGACKRATKCTKDDECADDEDCVNGFCKRAGTAGGEGSCALATVYFGYDEAAIQESERARLGANVECIQKNKGKAIYVMGHSDTSGTEEYNIALSERRAQTAADYMARLGVDAARLQIVPKGETEPTGLGDDKDRRCEFQWR